ncbi:unnamed protein product [Aphanomyces euteiches]|uniref:Uncharacterized protein n=1 Tax=Aphanomyces euteiches TaxID=100861 RepID=A0A6G0WYA4_9STRA|nr:hypothetical protein Ae201684_010458 [Aphanomyces euteiches]KAH9089987.1 hypothetical protein Ae201684P_014742 [Aphanomyces euteiches]KAH9138600.1 hypothetical protein AeRB84_017111 [Aphanomyces euteiches]
MENRSNDVSCSVSASSAPPRGASRENAVANNREQTHEVFGDANLNVVMLVLVLFHVMQYMMQGPCTC